ncbi:MAG: thiamine pyrophosphate-dependent dehydrogenase E1 component subunit alpha [Thermodesulfobacteriota bacterium]|nr:thiamine pyrophosphate-dependent dehydrogenase E1 component subunit alpha [Thermodesulfobacteriota bacterium]
MIPKEKLIEMYEKMVRIRLFEEKAVELFFKGVLPGFLHSSVGQEAVSVGGCSALREDDYMISTHRGHGDIIAKGARVDLMMAELFAKKTGYCKGKGGSMHIADLDLGILGTTGIVGAGLPIINGAALACQLKGTDQVSLCFFGDGASNTGSFHEALNLASVWNLPVIFVCQNNLYAESTPQWVHQKIRDISMRGGSYGIPGMSVDGNDVLAVYQAVSEAVESARKKEGPTLIECKTYRWLGHYVGDPSTSYRTKEEVEEWKKRDPIKRYRRNLLDTEVCGEKNLEAIDRRVEKEIEEAVEFAQNSPDPNPEDALEDVYIGEYIP